MSKERDPQELHPPVHIPPPLTPKEAESMGRQTETYTRGEKITDEVVYGDVENSPENEDQVDAHHADADDIV